jgi:hypothetical protein
MEAAAAAVKGAVVGVADGSKTKSLDSVCQFSMLLAWIAATIGAMPTLVTP